MSLLKGKYLVLLAGLVLIGCGGGGGSPKSGGQNFDPNDYPKYNLTQENKDDLAYMGNEERLAYNVYMGLYDYFQDKDIEIKQLYNIANKSESYHISIVRDLVRKYEITPSDLTIISSPVGSSSEDQSELPADKYGVEHIQELYDALMAKGKNSQQDALEVGCMVEVTDIYDLDERIENAKESGAQDLIDGFNILRNGSYNHYWAFDDGLKALGVDDGCCSLGVIDGVDYCHPEYPK